MTLDLLSWRPTEEMPAKFKRTAADPRDYSSEWSSLTVTQWAVVERIRAHADRLLAAGAKRISMDELFNAERAAHATSLDNSHRAAAARWLIDCNHNLAGVIRTRATTRTK